MGPRESKEVTELRESNALLISVLSVMKSEADEREKKYQAEKEAMAEKLAVLLLALLQAKLKDHVLNDQKKTMEIEGVTYEMYQFVDKGGFGEVYKARSPNNEERAIKYIHATSNVRSQIEAEVGFLKSVHLIKLEHHPIIEYYGCQMAENGMYIAMELADHDLYKFWVHRISAAANPEAKFMIGVLIFMYVLRALVFLEKLNIVHGDIKPSNLVVIERKKTFLVKLIDFGTVERLDTRRSQKTVASGKAFTPLFVAPEFLNFSIDDNQKRIHKKGDAWSAGVVFYYLLYDRFPWPTETDYLQFANRPNTADIIAPAKDGFEDIIHLLLIKNREQRSTSEDALKAMKSHDKLKVTVQALETKFYRVDDVCQMDIPPDVRRQLNRKVDQQQWTNSPR